MTHFNVSNPDWELNVSTGNFIAKTGENTRLLRMRAGGNEYMYKAEFWGDYSSGYPKDGGWHSSIASAVKNTEKTIQAEEQQPSDLDSYPDDENVYAYFPTEARTPRHKKNFEKIFRDWARAVRTGGDPLHMAERLEEANPGNPTCGIPGTGFRFQIELMFNPATRQRIIQAVKKKSFVRFHIRSPSAKKIWLMV